MIILLLVILFVFYYRISVQNPDEKYLEEVGACYLGDYPTVMVKGSLVMDTSCEKTVSIRNKPMIVGCNSGAICKLKFIFLYYFLRIISIFNRHCSANS